MKSMIGREAARPTTIPIPTAPTEWSSRFRSSTRCSNSDIFPPLSSSSCMFTTVSDWLGVAISDFLGIHFRGLDFLLCVPVLRGAFPRRCGIRASLRLDFRRSDRVFRRLLSHLRHFRVPFELPHVLLEPRAQALCRSSELRRHLPQLPCQLRQLLRSKHEQRDQKNDDQMGNTQHFLLRDGPPLHHRRGYRTCQTARFHGLPSD